MEDLDNEPDLDTKEVGPPVPPATREAPVAEPGAGAVGVRKATIRHHRSPPGGLILVESKALVAAAVATTASPALQREQQQQRGLSALVGRLARDM